jgi:hypothetical protein
MGLDSFAVYGKGHDCYMEHGDNSMPDNIFHNVPLVGSMMTSGCSSFRGKVYSEYVTWVTDQTLYEEFIDSDDVRVMAIKLSQITPNDFDLFVSETGNTYQLKYMDAVMLGEWFQVLADNDGSLVGWW